MSYAGVVGARDRRLLLVSSRARNKPAMYGAVLPGVRSEGENTFHFHHHNLDTK